MQREKTQWNINPKRKAPLPQTTHTHREGVIGAKEINVTAPMKPCLTSIICIGGLEPPVHRKLLLHLVDVGGLVAVVVEKA